MTTTTKHSTRRQLQMANATTEQARARNNVLRERFPPRSAEARCTAGTLRRAVAPKAAGHLTWAEESSTGRRRNLTYEETEAFWAFAAIEVLRLTGIRNEELLELTHHSITEYRLPSTGEVVPLLQVAPSKTDSERLLLAARNWRTSSPPSSAACEEAAARSRW